MTTYRAARRALLQGETSCEALVSSFLSRIEAAQADYNIFLSVDGAGALARARELDAQRAAWPTLPLAGLVVAVKDVISLKDRPLTCGSRMLADFRALYDATALARLREAGAIFIGKVNCDAFAMGSTNEQSHFGPVRNPRNPAYVPGGSSGGSAAAVAAQLCHVALGSDTGGSVRQPAAFCGVVGLKPTYGRISRYGLVAHASSLDTIGVLAQDPADVASVLHVMAGVDPADATSAPVPVPDYAAEQTGTVAGLRIGVPSAYLGEGLEANIRAQLDTQVAQLQAKGATVQDVALPHTEYGIATYYIISTAEASSNLARYDGVRYGYRADPEAVRREQAEATEAEKGSLLEAWYTRTRTEGFGAEVKRRIMLGTYVLSAGYYEAYYAKAQKVRTLIRRDFEAAFAEVDVLLTPAAPTTAFPLGSQLDDPLQMYLGDIYTVTANLAGIPGLVVPVGTHPNGLPVGLQLLGRPFEEGRLLGVGEVMMKLAGTMLHR